MVVVDASALIAVLDREKGWDRVPPAPERIITSVNAAEVVTHLVQLGAAPGDAFARIGMSARVEPADDDLGFQAGALHAVTRPLKLSLADCFCLAFARREGLAVITSDKAWSKVDLGLQVIQFR